MSDTKIIPKDTIERIKNITTILMDVDGVLTAGMIVYDSNGLEIKHFNAHDGLGIKMAKSAGIKTGIISARESGTIRIRAAEMKMDYLNLGRWDKLPAFKEFQEETKILPENCCFIGDDLPDIPVMKQVGLAIAVNNATELTKRNAHYVTNKRGGDGAVREAIELILKFQGKLESTIEKLWNEK
jgi:3-deoxy-D-manno-octulosonate 8-phosphate phosphatase (KDO 8-P phosphatase)